MSTDVLGELYLSVKPIRVLPMSSSLSPPTPKKTFLPQLPSSFSSDQLNGLNEHIRFTGDLVWPCSYSKLLPINGLDDNYDLVRALITIITL